MKRSKKFLAGVLAAAMSLSMLAGCTGGDTSSPASSGDSEPSSQTQQSGGEISFKFWTAPEQYNLDFWTKYAEKFNAAGVQLDGKTIKVEVQMMPAQPSSEAGIQNGIATGTIPAVSENINRNFAGTLADSQAVYDIANEDWFKAIVAERKLESIMEGWAIGDAQYVVPLYVNPPTIMYNSKALKELGVTKVPETTAEFTDLLNKYKEKAADLKGDGVTHFFLRPELVKPADWWERWFDFTTLYYAFSGGKAIVDGDKLVATKDDVKKVFDFYGQMGSSLLTGDVQDAWNQDTVQMVCGISLPWNVAPMTAAGKEYGMDKDYIVGPNPVEKAGDTSYCFADSKGLVFYKNAAVSDEQHNAAVEFVKWVMTDGGKDTFDTDWLESTAMLPVRGDIDTNANVQAYFEKNPAMKDIASYVANAIPCMENPKMSDIYTKMAEQGLTPYITEQVANAEIGATPDSSSYVDKAMSAMKEAGSLQ